MSIYEGKRTIDGLVVTKDGVALNEHYEVKQFTTWGFEWTYEGDSPQQLALAILVEHLADKQRALALSEPFMRQWLPISTTTGRFRVPTSMPPSRI